MTLCPETRRERLIARASEPYRAAGRFSFGFGGTNCSLVPEGAG